MQPVLTNGCDLALIRQCRLSAQREGQWILPEVLVCSSGKTMIERFDIDCKTNGRTLRSKSLCGRRLRAKHFLSRRFQLSQTG